uniref:F-box protein AT5G49610-like beta-propeller domain-containing protein n=1 Tax=Aegilops tauschii TaxID=37682 RepID=M8D269_AEGTA
MEKGITIVIRRHLKSDLWYLVQHIDAFARRFRIHHRRNPPLLGYFHGDFDGLRFEPVHFEPTLEAPDRVPPGRLSLQFDSYARVLGCRHGLVLILDQAPVQLLVWDPVTGHQHRLPTHTEFDLGNFLINGVVLRSAAGEVHFQVVLVVSDYEKRLLTCVYSSETGVWGTLISTPVPSENSIVCSEPAVLVGDSLYWILAGSTTFFNLLEFDLKTESLAMIQLPADKSCDAGGINSTDGHFTVMQAEGFTVQLWKRKHDFDGVASWGMERTIELDKLLSMDSEDSLTIQGYAEDNNLAFLWTGRSVFMVKLEPFQCEKLLDTNKWDRYYPFETVYAAVYATTSASVAKVPRFVFGCRDTGIGFFNVDSSIFHTSLFM